MRKTLFRVAGIEEKFSMSRGMGKIILFHTICAVSILFFGDIWKGSGETERGKASVFCIVGNG
jgi:hypothetical protein